MFGITKCHYLNIPTPKSRTYRCRYISKRNVFYNTPQIAYLASKTRIAGRGESERCTTTSTMRSGSAQTKGQGRGEEEEDRGVMISALDKDPESDFQLFGNSDFHILILLYIL